MIRLRQPREGLISSDRLEIRALPEKLTENMHYNIGYQLCHLYLPDTHLMILSD
ncbi:hypothetical protein SDC9_18398 [bioreactor metagenome]|uniref:Uncharacterized protein n=1 Tax=bioreactor metagenome TaxID=1076179 RepID=A0A644U2J2_9ZZZZ